MYRHAGIDIYLSGHGQGQGLGTEAVALLARFLCGSAGTTGSPSTRRPPTTGPSAATRRSGFRRVGVLRQYERGPDGQFHDGLLMDLLRPELAGTPGECRGTAP